MEKRLTRSEDAALKAYPKIATVPKMVNVEDGTIYDANASKRKYFIQGYEQAEEDTIDRAIQWLIAHADDYIVDMEVSRYKPSKLHVGGMCWEHLKQAMEKE